MAENERRKSAPSGRQKEREEALSVRGKKMKLTNALLYLQRSGKGMKI